MIKHENLTNQIKNYWELSGVDMYSCLVSWHAAALCFAFHISSVISCTNFICIVHMHRTCVELSVSTSFLCTLCYWYWSATWNWACPILARFSLDFRHAGRKPGLVERIYCYVIWPGLYLVNAESGPGEQFPICLLYCVGVTRGPDPGHAYTGVCNEHHQLNTQI